MCGCVLFQVDGDEDSDEGGSGDEEGMPGPPPGDEEEDEEQIKVCSLNQIQSLNIWDTAGLWACVVQLGE